MTPSRLLPAASFAAFALVSALGAAITHDASSSGSATATTSVTWQHVLGGGEARALVVGIAVEDGSATDATVTGVTIGGTALSQAAGSKIAGGGSSRMQTELWTLAGHALPAAGSHAVTVTFTGSVDAVTAGAVSFFGVSATGNPEAVTAASDTSGRDDITTSITTRTAGAWVVDVVGSGNAGAFTAGSGQEPRMAINGGTAMSGAISTKAVPVAGATPMAWTHANAPRLTHSLLALAPGEAGPPPATYALGTTIVGSGTVTRSPDASAYTEGTSVTLTAVPASGWVFAGWSGDLAGSTNPTTVTMSAARSVTATFIEQVGPVTYALTTTTSGSGTIARSPNAAAYEAGTVVTLTATPATGWTFAGWTGALSGTTNPATLAINAASAVGATFSPIGGTPDFSLVGWATAGAGTTGGAGGPTVTVRTYAEFLAAIATKSPLVILVDGMIVGTGDQLRVERDKTILGLGANSGFRDLGLQIGWNSAFGLGGNVILRNLTFDRVRAPTDKVLIAYGAKNVWVDHCVFVSDRDNGTDFYDGQLDITHGSDFVTVSWCRFVDHFKNSLVGHTENNASEDAGHLTVTYHHNWFLRTNSRNPSVRYGLVHVFNNLYQDISDYGIASRRGAQVVIENNVFRNVLEPVNADTNLSAVPGFVRGIETNLFVASGPNSIITEPATWVPPYAYTLRPVGDVAAIVEAWSGVGVIDPAGPPPTGTAPTIVSHPASATVAAGDTATLQVVATGTAPLSYAWTRGGQPVAGATGAVLAIADFQEADQGTYLVTVTNAAGSATSNPASLVLAAAPLPPTIVSHPASASFAAGETITLAVEATGSGPLLYQWYRGTTPIDDAITDTLVLDNIQSTAAGSYTVTVTNAAGTATSNPAVLAFGGELLAPVITGVSGSQSIVEGGTVLFSVTASGGLPFTYQWFKGDQPIALATTSVLAISGATAADAATYRVAVSNATGTTVSDPIVLTVTTPPDENTTTIVVAPGGSPTAPGTLAQPTTLERAIALVPPGGTILLRGGTYAFATQVTIDRSNSGAPGLPKRLWAYAPPGGTPEVPVLDFSSQPYGRTSQVSNPRGIWLGGNRWHLKGLVVFRAADNGIFVAGNDNVVERCVTHGNRDTGLQIARYSSLAPASEWPSRNIVLNCESYDNHDEAPNDGENADGFAAKLTSGPGNVFIGCVAHHNIDDGWDLYTKSDTGPIGSVVIDRCIAHDNGTLTNGTVSTAGDRNGFKLGGEKIPVIHHVTRSIAFRNGKNGFTWNSNPAAIRMINNLAFDNLQGNYKFDLPGPVFLNNVSLYTSTKGVSDRYGGNSGIATGPTNLFWFVGSSTRGPSLNDAGLKVTAASFRSLVPPAAGFARRADGRLSLGDFGRPVAGSPLINAGALPSAEILAALPYGAEAYEGNPDIGAVETFLAAPPVIVAQPTGASVLAGTAVTLSVAAEGTEPFTYAWTRGGEPVPGGNGPELTLLSPTAADSGSYAVTVSNAFGSATSRAVAVTVAAPAAPAIVTHPAGRTVAVGLPTVFTVTVSGTAPFAYQWFRGTTRLSGATAASLALGAVTPDDAGSYTVVVTNAHGTATGGPAVLVVDTTPVAPVLTLSPSGTQVVVGQTATFTAAATGSAPLSWQWYKGAFPIAGATAPTLVLADVRASDAGLYSVVVANAAGNARSAAAALAVAPGPDEVVLDDRFGDGSRGGQSLPGSAAWWTSSGSSNFTASVGSATQSASSSRTVVGYVTQPGQPQLVVADGQTLVLEATLAWSGFDTGAAGASTLRVGLLRSVANPLAVSGTGFTVSGTPNTNARVSGDFGSGNPASNVFQDYRGYVAQAAVQGTTPAAPPTFSRRDQPHPGLLNNALAFTALAGTDGTALAATANADHRLRFSVSRAGGVVTGHFRLARADTGAVVLESSFVDASPSNDAFDTVAFYFSKAAASATYSVTFRSVAVTRVNDPLAPGVVLADWAAGSGLPAGQRGPLDDPDRDGRPNLLVFALGLDVDPAAYPAAGVATGPAGNHPTMTWRARPDALGVAVTPQLGLDPGFAARLVPVTVSVTTLPSGLVETTVRSPATLDEEPIQFFRLVAEASP